MLLRIFTTKTNIDILHLKKFTIEFRCFVSAKRWRVKNATESDATIYGQKNKRITVAILHSKTWGHRVFDAKIKAQMRVIIPKVKAERVIKNS